MTHGLRQRQQSAICDREHARHQTCEVVKWLKGWRPLGGSICIEQAHSNKTLVEICKQADFVVVFHGFLNGDCCLDYFNVVVWLVEVDGVLNVDQRMSFEIEPRHDAYSSVSYLYYKSDK